MSSGDAGHICADIVARVSEGYHFEGMADYQHVVAVHADAAKQRKKGKRQWGEIEDPHFGQAHYIPDIYNIYACFIVLYMFIAMVLGWFNVTYVEAPPFCWAR
jgi:hypothetical protein